MIVETYLPYDYFAQMIGVLVDEKVLLKLIEKDFNELERKF